MTGREAWDKALEASPGDSGLRGIFADWLDENGEPELAEGYRAMAAFDVRVRWVDDEHGHTGLVPPNRTDNPAKVTSAWYRKAVDLCLRFRCDAVWPSLAACEDNAALAYYQLTDEQKEEVRLFRSREEVMT